MKKILKPIVVIALILMQFTILNAKAMDPIPSKIKFCKPATSTNYYAGCFSSPWSQECTSLLACTEFDMP